MGEGALGRASQGPAVIASVSPQATGNQGPTHANARPTAPGMGAIGGHQRPKGCGHLKQARGVSFMLL